MKANKIVLVTGATGFIASNLIPALLDKGFQVVGMDKLPLEGKRVECFQDEIEFFQIDLLEEAKLKARVKQINPQYAIHLAAYINVGRDPDLVRTIMQNNLGCTLNLYNALLELKELKSVVTVGSADEYGNNEPPFVENMMPMPISAYGLSKTAITFLSMMYHRSHKLPVVVLRPFLVYGPGQTNAQFVPYFIRECLKHKAVDLTPGEQTRDFLYVGDLIEAIIAALVQPKVYGEVLNVCSGKQHTIKQVALLIKQLIGSKQDINFGAQPYRKGENMRFFGSNEKIKQLLNWEPRTSLEEGLKRAIEWYS